MKPISIPYGPDRWVGAVFAFFIVLFGFVVFGLMLGPPGVDIPGEPPRSVWRDLGEFVTSFYFLFFLAIWGVPFMGAVGIALSRAWGFWIGLAVSGFLALGGVPAAFTNIVSALGLAPTIGLLIYCERRLRGYTGSRPV